MKIQIFGSGCSNCKTVKENTKKAVSELKLKDVTINHIYDINTIAEMGIISTPAIIVDNEIKATGRIPDIDEIKNWLQ